MEAREISYACRKPDLTQARLQELFEYSPETGKFTRLVPVKGEPAGKVAGNRHAHGAVVIWVDGRRFLAHRLAWLYMTGCFPDQLIDHKNRNGHDNRWENLRLATAQQNMANRPGNGGRSGIKGVYWDGRKSRWYVQIRQAGRTYYGGSYADVEEAKAAAQAQRTRIHKNFACHG